MSKTPRYDEWQFLRTHGQWSDGVPGWARDYSGSMNDFTAASAVIEELASLLASSSTASVSAEAKPVNQCDGCRVNAPMHRPLMHTMPDGGFMACTADRYTTPAQSIADTAGAKPCEVCDGVGRIGTPGHRCFGCEGSGQSKFASPAIADTARAKPVVPTEFEQHGELDAEGWTPPVFPERQYFMQCCDCGLVHELEFAAVKTEPTEGGFHSDELPWPENRVRFKVRRAPAEATKTNAGYAIAVELWKAANAVGFAEFQSAVERLIASPAIDAAVALSAEQALQMAVNALHYSHDLEEGSRKVRALLSGTRAGDFKNEPFAWHVATDSDTEGSLAYSKREADEYANDGYEVIPLYTGADAASPAIDAVKPVSEDDKDASSEKEE